MKANPGGAEKRKQHEGGSERAEGRMERKQAWKEDWKQDLVRMTVTVVIIGLLGAGIILLLSNGKNFLTAVKPAYDMDYVIENGAKKGMHISGEVPFIYDCFAEMENTGNNRVTAYYYAIPSGDGMIVLQLPTSMRGAAEKLLEETVEYLSTGMPPASAFPIEGYVKKAEGRLPYLLSQYMAGMGYSEAEIQEMGEPLMIQEAGKNLDRARIYAPVGMILLGLGILASVFAIYRMVRRS